MPLTLEAEGGQLVRAMQVQCGAQHTVVLVQHHGRLEVRTVGDNSYGQLGLGDRTERHRFHPISQLQVRFFWYKCLSLLLGTAHSLLGLEMHGVRIRFVCGEGSLPAGMLAPAFPCMHCTAVSLLQLGMVGW